jgi:membrane associated rhomboid family serine protease
VQNPPIQAAKKTEDPEPNQNEWDVTGPIPDKPATADYGYVINGNVVTCTQDELVSRFASRGPAIIKFVWTPDTPQPVFPENVSFMVQAFKQLALNTAWKNFLWGTGFIGFGVMLALAYQDWKMLYINILSIVGALVIVETIWQWMRARNYSQEDALADASSLRFDAWIKHKRIKGYAFGVAALLVVVGGCQVIFGEVTSFARAGLVKPAVWQGEVWRLFTACLMHASWMHFWMNFLALLHFSRVIEQAIHRAYIPFVFLLSGALGSVFSVVLYPNITSVGASGGLMGLMGFITVAAYFDKKSFPSKYVRNSIEGIVMVGAFGLLGFAFIDNGAHLGGLIGGLVLGWLILRPRQPEPDRSKLSQRAVISGTVALLVLAGFAVVAILRMYG